MAEQSKSSMIKQLHDEGLTVSEIKSRLNLRYQFVYNVLLQSRREPKVAERSTESKSSLIKKAYEQTKNVSEAAKLASQMAGSEISYQFAYNVLANARMIIKK